MLDRLPPEVILTISSLITLKDKLALITTCRHLFNLISKTNLYSELNLRRCNEKMEKVISKFINSRYPGSQVKKLEFDTNSMPDELLFQLSTAFPNITQVKTTTVMMSDVTFQDRYTKGPMLQWRNTLQKFDLCQDWPEVLPILKTATFPRLTELALSDPFTFEDKKEGFDIPYFLPVFKNVRSLKKLHLSYCAIDFDFLEEVHTSCPHLESLSMYNPQIIIRQHSLPSTIIPANSLLTLRIDDCFCFDLNGLLLEYITRKYRCIKQLKLILQKEYDTLLFNSYYCPQVEDIDQDEDEDEDVVQAPEYIPLYRSLQHELIDTRAAYRESGPSFFSDLTTTIESIIISSDLFNNIIQVMTDSSIEPVELYLSDEMEDPLQILYVEEFKKLKSLSLDSQMPDQIYSHDILCNNITKLEIASGDNILYIDWLLSSFPSLEYFKIFGLSTLKTTENSTKATKNQFPNLWKLTADATFIAQTCFDFLKMTAPNIRELEVTVCDNTGLKDVSIDISGWELRKLDLEIYHKFTPVPLFVNIATQNSTNIFKYDPFEHSLAVVKNNARFGLKKQSEAPNIVSNREKQFKFNGFSMSLSLDNTNITFENK